MENRNLGGRPKKLQIELNSDSIKSMLQTVWNEAEETKLKGINQFNKINKEMREIDDIALVGKLSLEALKLINDASEKRISCVKIIQSYIQRDAAVDTGATSGPAVVSEEDKAAIRELFNQNKKAPEPPVKTIEETQKYEDKQVEKLIQGEAISDSDITDAPF